MSLNSTFESSLRSCTISLFFNHGLHPEIAISKAPNQMRIVREAPQRDEAIRYQQARRQQALYKAAAKLWQKGVPMSQAVDIVVEVVQESTGH